MKLGKLWNYRLLRLMILLNLLLIFAFADIVRAQPEIEIRNKYGVVIANGDMTPSWADRTYLGEADIHGTLTRYFTGYIHNLGSTDLYLIDSSGSFIKITGPNASDFTATGGYRPNTVTPGNSLRFDILFNPITEGLRTAIVSIASNDSDENPYTFQVQGVGVDYKPYLINIDQQHPYVKYMLPNRSDFPFKNIGIGDGDNSPLFIRLTLTDGEFTAQSLVNSGVQYLGNDIYLYNASGPADATQAIQQLEFYTNVQIDKYKYARITLRVDDQTVPYYAESWIQYHIYEKRFEISQIDDQVIEKNGSSDWIFFWILDNFRVNSFDESDVSYSLYAFDQTLIPPQSIFLHKYRYEDAPLYRYPDIVPNYKYYLLKLKIAPAINTTGQTEVRVCVHGENEYPDPQHRSFLVTVVYAGSAPIISTLPDVTFHEDESASLNLSEYCSDMDHDNAQLIWHYEILDSAALSDSPSSKVDEYNLLVDINPETQMATFTGKNNYYGINRVVFTVTDPDNYSDSDTISVEITPVNDPPVLTLPDIPRLVFIQGEVITIAYSFLHAMVNDPDSPDSVLIWSMSENNCFQSIVQDDSIRVHITSEWTGKDTLTVQVSDGENTVSEQLVVYVLENEDLLAPQPPSQVTAQIDQNFVTLTWATNSEPDVVSYNIYRSTDYSGSYMLVGQVSHPEHCFTDSTATELTTYFYQINCMDVSGNISDLCDPVEVNLDVTNVKNEQEIPASFSLSANYPNPFNSSTTITFALPSAHYIDLCVYNMNGQKVADLIHEMKPAGVYSLSWDASALSNGVYFYQMRAGNFTQIRKCMLMK